MSEAIHEAMAAAFENMPEVNKDGTNPHFGSSYATLGNIVHKIRPELAKHGLYFIQRVEQDEKGRQGVRTIIGHKSGGQIDAGLTIVTPKKEGAHEQGSALTYARRYGLCAALGVVDEQDDDGNAAAAGGQNGRGRPVSAKQPNADWRAFQLEVVNQSKMHGNDANALCRDIVNRLGLDAKTATSEQWAGAIATVKDKGGDLFAWATEDSN